MSSSASVIVTPPPTVASTPNAANTQPDTSRTRLPGRTRRSTRPRCSKSEKVDDGAMFRPPTKKSSPPRPSTSTSHGARQTTSYASDAGANKPSRVAGTRRRSSTGCRRRRVTSRWTTGRPEGSPSCTSVAGSEASLDAGCVARTSTWSCSLAGCGGAARMRWTGEPHSAPAHTIAKPRVPPMRTTRCSYHRTGAGGNTQQVPRYGPPEPHQPVCGVRRGRSPHGLPATISPRAQDWVRSPRRDRNAPGPSGAFEGVGVESRRHA